MLDGSDQPHEEATRDVMRGRSGVTCSNRGATLATVILAGAAAITAGCAPQESVDPTVSEETVGAPAPAPVTAPSNVLLVTIDTLRWDTLGSYGGPAATPALDRLAREGTRFEHVTAHAVVTLPSHVSILTGLDPSRHGVHNNTGFRAGDDLVTWAERLRDAGYATGAFVGAFPLDSQFGIAQGFDHYDDRYSVGTAASDFTIVERPAPEVVDAARAWIGEQEGLWFVWVHVYEPHAPYEPPEPYASQYSDNPYAGEVAAVDAALSPLLADALESDTLVVVTSDHGEGLGQHDEYTHGLFAYDATLRVPMFFARPGVIPSAKVVSDWGRHIDILPTVLDYLGLPTEDLQGRSLAPMLVEGSSRPEAAQRPAYFEALTPYLTRGWAPLRGIREGSYKFVELPVPELYDLSFDPEESDNLAFEPDGRRRVEALRAALAEHLAEVDDAGIEVAPETEETLRRLRALGYIGASAQPDAADSFGPEDDPKNLVHLDQKIHEAVNASRVSDWSTAATILREVVDERPDFAWAHNLLAGVSYRSGDLAGAIGQLEVAVASGLVSPFILNKLAFYLRKSGRLPEARAVLETSLQDEPDNLETLNLLAGVTGELGDGPGALRMFSQALAADPTHASLNANHGMALLSMGRVDEARTAFETALGYDPLLAEAENGLGVVAAQSGDMEQAVERWRRAVELDPEFFDALYNLGIVLTRLNRFAEAVPVLQDFVDRAPSERYASDIEGVRRLLAQIRGR